MHDLEFFEANGNLRTLIKKKKKKPNHEMEDK
jgi:hypothetical protein